MQLLNRGLNRSLRVATALLFTIMVLAVVWQVFTREVIQSPAAWTEELAKYVFVWTSLVGAALVFSERGHIAVTFVVERLPRPVRMGVAVLIQLVILFFALAILVYGGVLAAQNTWSQQLTALPGTIGQAYLVLPITGVIISLIAVLHIVEDLRGTGPLTSAVARTEEEVPVIAGLEDAVEDSPLAERERTSDPEDSAGTDDSAGTPRDNDSKER
ncbi:TRAP transporter small permease [Brachybacterium sp. AOP42-C2-15]|uniref:TRAP transporter small permease n=1 Tax=unclassified Brachybacterium TaxID=2623841 RepID=UPI003F96C4FF